MTIEIKNPSISNHCKMNCKWILTTAAITLLAASSVYLFVRNDRQKEAISAQERYINELKANFTQNNSDNNINRYFNTLFDNTWLSFKQPLDIISKSWDNASSASYYSQIGITATDNEYIITVGFTRLF